MSEKCCCCIPIECGIQTLAILTWIGTGLLAFDSWHIRGAIDIYWPSLACCGFMSLFWLYPLCSPSEASRKQTLLVWLIFVVILGRISYLVIILNGSALELWCTGNNLEVLN